MSRDKNSDRDIVHSSMHHPDSENARGCVYHSNDLYLVQRCWYAELSAIKTEIEHLLTKISDLMEQHTHIGFVQKSINLLNLLVGANMRFNQLITELDNEKEVLSKYPSTFPIAPCNRSYKKHFQLETRVEEEKQKFYNIKIKVNYTMHQHLGDKNKVID